MWPGPVEVADPLGFPCLWDTGDARAGSRRGSSRAASPSCRPPRRQTPGPAAPLQPGAGSGVLGLPGGLGAPEEEEDEEKFPPLRVVQPDSVGLDKSGIKPTREI